MASIGLKDTIDLLIKKSEESIKLSKKRTESVVKIQALVKENNKTIEEYKKIVDDLKIESSKNSFFYKESLIKLSAELKESYGARDSYIEKINSLDEKYKNMELSSIQKIDDYIKNRKNQLINSLNAHYYVLQKAFNDYIQSKSSADPYKEKCDDMANKINEIDKRLMSLFFDKVSPSNDSEGE